MKKYALVLAALAMTLGLSACNDLSTPESTVASAYTAIKKGKLSDLRETLTGDAAAAYGNAEGLARLKRELAGLQVKMGARQYVSGQRHGYWHETYVYQLEVLARAKGTETFSRLKTATVVCDWHRGRTVNPIPHDPSGIPEMDQPDWQECKISALN